MATLEDKYEAGRDQQFRQDQLQEAKTFGIDPELLYNSSLDTFLNVKQAEDFTSSALNAFKKLFQSQLSSVLTDSWDRYHTVVRFTDTKGYEYQMRIGRADRSIVGSGGEENVYAGITIRNGDFIQEVGLNNHLILGFGERFSFHQNGIIDGIIRGNESEGRKESVKNVRAIIGFYKRIQTALGTSPTEQVNPISSWVV